MYDAVVFDVDGVLLQRHADHPDVYGDAVAETFQSFGLDPSPRDVEAFYGTATVDGMEQVCERHGLGLDHFWPERERRVSALQQRMMERGERVLYDDCTVLSRLSDDHDLGIVSSNQQETISFMVEQFDLADHFDAVYGRDPSVDGFRRTKPDTHYVDRALDDLCTRSALFVGDSADDVVAAARAGIDSAFVRRPHRVGYVLSEEPTHEIDQLTELVDVVSER